MHYIFVLNKKECFFIRRCAANQLFGYAKKISGFQNDCGITFINRSALEHDIIGNGITEKYIFSRCLIYKYKL